MTMLSPKTSTGRGLLVLAALLVALTACQRSPTAGEEPFRHVMEMGGRSVSLEGNSRGHEPGSALELTVRLDNASGEAWGDGYCVLLVNQVGLVANLADNVFDLAPGQAVTDAVHTWIPEGADADAYGLKVLIPGTASLGTTVYLGLGNNDEPPAERVGDGAGAPTSGHWADVPECQTGQLAPLQFSIDRTPGTAEPQVTPV